jgi:putative ABC transport system permease protein
MIGVALVGFITVFASSATKSIDRIVDERFKADVILEAGQFGGGGLSPDLAASLRELPEVDSVAELRFSDAVIDGDSGFLLGVSDGIEGMFDIDVLEGGYDGLDETTIGLHADYADEHGFALGDTVAVELVGGGEQNLRVAMIYDEQTLAGPYFVHTDVFDLYARDNVDGQIFVMAKDGVSADAILAAVERAAEPYPNANVDDIAGFKEGRAAQFQLLVNLIYGMLGLAIFIALLGIANTLALSIHERTRELGVLRAVGMTRGQVRSAVRWESVLIALLGTGVGLGIGLFFGWAMSRAMRSEGFTEFSIPFQQLAVICALAAICGVLAAIWPARRASRLNVLDAIATG